MPALRLMPALRMMPAWHGMEYMTMWHEVEIIVAYDIVLEKYDKLVKIMKLAKCGNIGPSSLKRMPTTNGLLKKIPAPHGDIVGCFFVYSTMVSVCPKRH